MDTNQSARMSSFPLPPHPVEAPLPTPIQNPEKPKSSNPLKILLITIGAVFVLTLILGAYYLGVKQNSSILVDNENIHAFPTKVPTPTPDLTGNWNFYSNGRVVIKYPTAWKTKANPQYGTSVEIYDPSSMVTGYQNGGGITSAATQYVNIVTQDSSETAKSYADKLTSSPVYISEGSVEKQITLNGQTAYMYKEAGEGSQGYDIVLSDNWSTLIVLNVPSSDITLSPISQILSTFMLLKQFNLDPGSTVQKYYNEYLTCVNDNTDAAALPKNCLTNTTGVLTQDLFTSLQQPRDYIPVTCAQNTVPYVTFGDTNVAKDNLSATQIVYPEPYHSEGQAGSIKVGLQMLQGSWKISSITCQQ